MKIFFNIIILIISINFNAQENYRAIYKLDFLIDSLEVKKRYEKNQIKSPSDPKDKMKAELSLDMKNRFLNAIKFSKNEYYNLDFNRDKSKFYKPNRIETKEYKSAKIFLRYRGIYYSFKNELLHKKNAYGQDFIVKKPKLKWEISSISKKIGKYTCFKAITQKKIQSSKGISYHDVIAWFVPEISFNHGPKGYGGLPGLIVRLDIGYLSYTIKKIKKLDFLELKKPTKGKIISLKDFEALGKKMYESRRNSF